MKVCGISESFQIYLGSIFFKEGKTQICSRHAGWWEWLYNYFLNTRTNPPGILWQEPDSEMILPLTCLSWRRNIIPAHINALKYNSADRLSKFKRNTILSITKADCAIRITNLFNLRVSMSIFWARFQLSNLYEINCVNRENQTLSIMTIWG